MEERRATLALDMSRAEMQAFGYRIVDMVVEHMDTLPDQHVTNGTDRRSLDQLLRKPLPEEPTSIDEVLRQVQQDVFGNIMHLQHPRFFAFVPSPSNVVSVMAETLIAGFNAFAGTWMAASGPEQVELVTIDWLRQLCGLPDTAGGLFVTGGSMATLTALAAARHVKLGDHSADTVIYCSDQTHTAVDRALHVLGFGTDQLRRVTSDDQFRLPVASLHEAIAADRVAGRRPFCVIANAGTTNSAAVDPMPELAALCQAEELWFHVDGAYGASAMLCDRGRRLLAGLEHADSLILDPHKWLFQPIEIGCVLLRDRRQLQDTFRVRADYLVDVDRTFEESNFCDYGVQLTRSFRALKLWMSLKVFGLAAFRSAVERGITLAEHAEALLWERPNWEVVTPAQLGIVTFRYAPPEMLATVADQVTDGLVDRMYADGFAMLSTTAFHGRPALRLCPINPRTTEQDLAATLDWLDGLAAPLAAEVMRAGEGSVQS